VALRQLQAVALAAPEGLRQGKAGGLGVKTKTEKEYQQLSLDQKAIYWEAIGVGADEEDALEAAQQHKENK
jgi:hypothetical protein